MKRKIQSVDATVTEHEEINSCPLKFAKSTNGLVVARNGVEDRSVYENLSCYECDEPLYYRRDHRRTRNGIEHDVYACFVHNRDNDMSRNLFFLLRFSDSPHPRVTSLCLARVDNVSEKYTQRHKMNILHRTIHVRFMKRFHSTKSVY